MFSFSKDIELLYIFSVFNLKLSLSILTLFVGRQFFGNCFFFISILLTLVFGIARIRLK